MANVQHDMVVSMDYSLHLGDNQIIDASEEGQPMTLVQGHGQIIAGLEAAIEGMALGEEKDIVVAPADGYGELDADLYEELPRSLFPPDVKEGMAFRMRTDTGQPVIVYVDKIEGENVTVNLNHPMAGKTLYFHVKIAGLREATPADLQEGCGHGCSSCGHSCGEDQEEEDEEESCGCEDEEDCGCSDEEDDEEKGCACCGESKN
jgi:FKBP-type peptidyl-prolyl cis-trans isomerase SlyD